MEKISLYTGYEKPRQKPGICPINEGVDFAASTAVYEEATGGSFAVLTCAMGDFGNLVPVENGGALELGKLICVKPAAAEGYELVSVVVNGSDAPTDYQVIDNGEIVPGESIFGAIVVSAETPVSVVVNGAATQINIPANGVIFYCFAVKEGGEFNVEINPA